MGRFGLLKDERNEKDTLYYPNNNFVDGNSLLHVSTFHFIFHIQNIISNSNCSNINYRGLWVRGDMVAICLCSKKAQKIHQRRCRKKIKARLIEGWVDKSTHIVMLFFETFQNLKKTLQKKIKIYLRCGQ